MKKLFLLLVAIMAVGLGTVGMSVRQVAAIDVLNQCAGATSASDCPACSNPNANGKPAICSDNQNCSSTDNSCNPVFGPNGILTVVMRILGFIVGFLSIIVIIVAGLRFIVSGGDPNSVSTARRAIIYALVGLVIAVFAEILVAFVISKVQ